MNDELKSLFAACGFREIFYSGCIHLVLSETWRSLEKKKENGQPVSSPQKPRQPLKHDAWKTIYISPVEMVPFWGDISFFGGPVLASLQGYFFVCVSDGTSNCSLVLKSWNGLWFFTQKSEPSHQLGWLYTLNSLPVGMKKTTTRWFKVTFSSPSWRSLNPLKGSLNPPKKVTKNCQASPYTWHRKSCVAVESFRREGLELDSQLPYNVNG